ncbi:hypothetical protein SEPCBS57363_004083 [Sporothrix epigloea]|uniref:Uncharacterized protein n=1 Tax=Sporothrix epigloea TaxID=1892477 RepID=A0ABP0DRY2_9PEZI
MVNEYFDPGYHTGTFASAPAMHNGQPFPHQEHASDQPSAMNGPTSHVICNNCNGAGYIFLPQPQLPPPNFPRQGFGPQHPVYMNQQPPNPFMPGYGSWQQSQGQPGQPLPYKDPHHQHSPHLQSSSSTILPPIPRRAKVPKTGQPLEIDIHAKVLFDCAEDLKDYFGALTKYIDGNEKGISFGFAIDIQGKCLGTPDGKIYVMNIMAQPVLEGRLLLCSDKALPEAQNDILTAEVRQLCRPHIVDLLTLGQRAFDVHTHCSSLTLRYILKQQSIPKMMWNPQNMAASLSKQFKIEMSLPMDDRPLAMPSTLATSIITAKTTEVDKAAGATKLDGAAAAVDETESIKTVKPTHPSSSAQGTYMGGNRSPHIPFSVPKGTTRKQNCLCDLQLLEIKAFKNRPQTDRSGDSRTLRHLDESVDKYLAVKGPYSGVVIPAVDEDRHDFRSQHLDLSSRLRVDTDALRVRPISPKDTKYFINCVQFLPLLHRIFEPLVARNGSAEAQKLLEAVSDGTSYRVRRKTAACVSGGAPDELAPEPTMAEIWGESDKTHNRS